MCCLGSGYSNICAFSRGNVLRGCQALMHNLWRSNIHFKVSYFLHRHLIYFDRVNGRLDQLTIS